MTNLLRWLANHDHARSALLLLVLLGASFYLLFLPEWSEAMGYQRSSFSAQPWQAFSHALVHLNLQHLSLNTLALLCMVALFPDAFRSAGWLFALLLSAAISALGLYLFSPLTDWCVG
ncbi:MAG: rhomboid family intramembrane serine protease, partial [Pseudomonadales bacterium]